MSTATHRPHCLIIGCGDIGTRLGLRLVEAGWSVSGLRRHADLLPGVFQRYSADVFALTAVDMAAFQPIDVVVYSITPVERSAAGYQRAYVEGVQQVMAAVSSCPPRLWLHFSSSRVWSAADGSWVNETTPTLAKDAPTQHLIDGEGLVATSGIPYTITRFSGLYGKGAESMRRMLERWRGYSPDSRAWTNRIHADDAAGFCAHLLQRWQTGESLLPLYAVSDDQPTTQGALARWLQSPSGQSLDAVDEDVELELTATGKRVDNQMLRDSGYRLRYPNYRVACHTWLDRKP